MKLLLDDKTYSGCNLNANEACIFAAILKCTRAGRGWYGNYRELAAAMPFVINRETARRAVLKLLDLGLIEKDAQNVLFAAQNVHNNAQNVQNDAQNVLPPNNPPIYNNMNENKEEQQRALGARDCEEQQDCLFEKFWKFFSVTMPAEFQNRKNAACKMFAERSKVAQLAIVEAAQEGAPGHPGDDPNPYFFVADFPEPQPVFLRGDEGGDIVQVRYNGAYKLCSRATMELFGLEWVRDW